MEGKLFIFIMIHVLLSTLSHFMLTFLKARINMVHWTFIFVCIILLVQHTRLQFHDLSVSVSLQYGLPVIPGSAKLVSSTRTPLSYTHCTGRIKQIQERGMQITKEECYRPSRSQSSVNDMRPRVIHGRLRSILHEGR